MRFNTWRDYYYDSGWDQLHNGRWMMRCSFLPHTSSGRANESCAAENVCAYEWTVSKTLTIIIWEGESCTHSQSLRCVCGDESVCHSNREALSKHLASLASSDCTQRATIWIWLRFSHVRGRLVRHCVHTPAQTITCRQKLLFFFVYFHI